MDKYSRYYGIIAFFVVMFVALYVAYKLAAPKITGFMNVGTQLEQKQKEYDDKLDQKQKVEERLELARKSIEASEKKIYSPADSDLGNDTLFFTLYNDVIEMLHANSIKIKSMKYNYNPGDDDFVKSGQDTYFVCEIDLGLVSNYTNLGKFIENIIRYPYYIKIRKVEVSPYEKDKKILISNVVLRLYAHTVPDEPVEGVNPQ